MSAASSAAEEAGMPRPASERRGGGGGVRTTVSLVEVLEGMRTHPDAGHPSCCRARRRLVSYGELRERAREVAALLQSLSLEPGDTVAIMLPTDVDYFFCFFGVLYAGLVPVPLYPPARPSQIEEHLRRHRKILANAGAKILITVPEVQTVALLLQTQVPILERVVTERSCTGAETASPCRNRQATAFLEYTRQYRRPEGVISATPTCWPISGRWARSAG
jgi:acyl-CoA synthetase (AMP-forming)/AMP-acid ligase II